LDVPGAETAECGEGKSDLDEERRVEDREEVGAGGRGQEREREAVVGGRGKDPVGDEEVEVDVEIDQVAEALPSRPDRSR